MTDETGRVDFDKIKKVRPIGEITPHLASLLGSEQKAGAIFIGPTNVEHMKREHPDDYTRYAAFVSDILATPDYVGINPNNGSLQFIKEYPPDHVLVAVRVTSAGAYFARSVYQISNTKLENYKSGGRLIDLKNSSS